MTIQRLEQMVQDMRMEIVNSTIDKRELPKEFYNAYLELKTTYEILYHGLYKEAE